ncbi:hypothetical protein EON77_05965 [bacterium]|nr:MAG: hypothetical protein EON77_05965 [bacterium]
MADAETELLTGTRTRPGPDTTRTIAAYETRLKARAKRDGYFGAVDDGPAQTRANLAKMRTATRTALELARNARERGVVARFLASELKE